MRWHAATWVEGAYTVRASIREDGMTALVEIRDSSGKVVHRWRGAYWACVRAAKQAMRATRGA